MKRDPSPKSVTISQERLRRPFAGWSLAVLSTVAVTASVTLDPSRAWSSQEPQAGSKADEKATPAPFDRTEFFKLLQTNKLSEAAQQLDAARKDDPKDRNLLMLENSLAMYQTRTADAQAGLDRYEKLLRELENNLATEPTLVPNYISTAQGYAQSLTNGAKFEAAIAVLDKAAEKLQGSSIPKATIAMLEANVASSRVRALVGAGRADEAKQAFDVQFDAALSKAKSDPLAASALANAYANYSGLLGSKFPEAAAEKAKLTAETLLAIADKEGAGLDGLRPYTSFLMSQASRLTYSDPKKAQELLADAKARLDKLSESLSEEEKKQLAPTTQQLSNMLRSIETALKREALVGTKATEFDAQAFVNMPEVKLADLKGKVVLLDFWAVWCGPCIATFPHLIHWNEEFGDKGLVIVGVTREYGYAWDEEQNRAVTKKGATTDEEMAMLEKFRQRHQLTHGFMVTPKESSFNKEFAVSGIPQAVVIDQDGIIRLIRVGSGDANAQAIEEMIKKLLSKSASSS